MVSTHFLHSEILTWITGDRMHTWYPSTVKLTPSLNQLDVLSCNCDALTQVSFSLTTLGLMEKHHTGISHSHVSRPNKVDKHKPRSWRDTHNGVFQTSSSCYLKPKRRTDPNLSKRFNNLRSHSNGMSTRSRCSHNSFMWQLNDIHRWVHSIPTYPTVAIKC